MAYKFQLYQEKQYTELPANAVGQTETDKYTEPANSDSDTLYVSKAGSDSTGDGTFANPYETLSKAFSEATATLHQVCIIDDNIYNLNSPLDMQECDSLFSKQGVQPWLQIGDTILDTGFISDLPEISGYTRTKMAVYNGELYAVLSDGTYTERVDKYDDVSATWTNVLTLANVNIVSIFANDTGIFFGTDNGKIYKAATEKSSTAAHTVRAICEFSSYLWAFVTDNSTGEHTVLRSADGETWTAQTDNVDSVLVSGQKVQSAVEFTADNDVTCMVIASEKQITYTNSDANGFASVVKTFLTNSTVQKLYVWNEELYILLDTGLWKTVDLSYFEYITDGSFSDITADVLINETICGKLYLSTTGNSVYRSIDGRNFSLFANGVNPYLCSYNGLIYSGEKVINSYFIKADKETEIHNIKFYSSIIDIGVFSPTVDYSAEITFQNCTFEGLQLLCNYGKNSLKVYNCDVRACFNGFMFSVALENSETLFAAIPNSVFLVENSFSIDVENITVYDFGFFIFSNDIATASNFIGSIFYFCHNEFYNAWFTVTLINCMISRVDDPEGKIIFAGSIEGNPLFKNKKNDYSPKSKKGGYTLPQENPVIENEIGAYILEFAEKNVTTPTEHELIAIPDISYDRKRVNFFGKDTISGDYITTFTRLRREINFSWKQIHDLTGDIQKLAELFGNDELCYLFVDLGVSGVGTVSTEQPVLSVLKQYRNSVLKVLYCPDLFLQSGQLLGFRLEDTDGNETTILWNTENKIYFSQYSDISEGRSSFMVRKMLGRFDSDSFSTETMFSREFDSEKEYENGLTLRFIQTDV